MKKEIHVAEGSQDMSFEQIYGMIPESIKPEVTPIGNDLVLIYKGERGILIWKEQHRDEVAQIRFIIADVLREKIYSRFFPVACMCCLAISRADEVRMAKDECKRHTIKRLHVNHPHLSPIKFPKSIQLCFPAELRPNYGVIDYW